MLALYIVHTALALACLAVAGYTALACADCYRARTPRTVPAQGMTPAWVAFACWEASRGWDDVDPFRPVWARGLPSRLAVAHTTPPVRNVLQVAALCDLQPDRGPAVERVRRVRAVYARHPRLLASG